MKHLLLLLTLLLLPLEIIISVASAQTCLVSNPSDTVRVSGNIDAGGSVVPLGSIPVVTAPNDGTPSSTTFADLEALAVAVTQVQIFDSRGFAHTLTFELFSTAANQVTIRIFATSNDVDVTPSPGIPRLVGSHDITAAFNGSGLRTNAPIGDGADLDTVVSWNNGATASSLKFIIAPVTLLASISDLATNANGSAPLSCTPSPTPTMTPIPTLTPSLSPSPSPSPTPTIAATVAPAPSTPPPTISVPSPTIAVPGAQTPSVIPTAVATLSATPAGTTIFGHVLPAVPGILVYRFGLQEFSVSDATSALPIDSTVTDKTGGFSFPGVRGFTYTIVPKSLGIEFTPSSLAATAGQMLPEVLLRPANLNDSNCVRSDHGAVLASINSAVATLSDAVTKSAKLLRRRAQMLSSHQSRKISVFVSGELSNLRLAVGAALASSLSYPTLTLVCAERPDCRDESYFTTIQNQRTQVTSISIIARRIQRKLRAVSPISRSGMVRPAARIRQLVEQLPESGARCVR